MVTAESCSSLLSNILSALVTNLDFISVVQTDKSGVSAVYVSWGHEKQWKNSS